jgi:hypothetical protein
MDQTGLRGELKDLHRGRGIRRPEVRSWLGPELQAVLDLAPDTSDDDVRTRLVRLIRDNVETFPRDLRYLFLVAAGVLVDEPFLEDRLAVAEKELDRSGRVLRRRLRVAEQLLADAIASRYEEGSSPFEDRGWQWEEHDLHLVLRKDAVLTLTRTLRALADHQKYVHEAFVIPGYLDPGAELEFEALEGLTLLDVDRDSPSHWGATLELPQTLRRGQTLRTCLRVRVPRARALNPYMVLAPLRPARSARVSVDFGRPPIAERAWIVNDAVPSDILGHPASVTDIDLNETPVVTAEVLKPRIGLAYGVGWSWAG